MQFAVIVAKRVPKRLVVAALTDMSAILSHVEWLIGLLSVMCEKGRSAWKMPCTSFHTLRRYV